MLNASLADFDGGLQAHASGRILHGAVFIEQGRSAVSPAHWENRPMKTLRCLASAVGLVLLLLAADDAAAQVVVYRPVVPMFAPAAGPYVANYTPAGNYAAVTAYSPPVFEAAAMPIAAPVVTEVAAPVAVTSYYAPTYVAPTYAAPTAVATTAFYAPAAPVVAAAPVVTAAPVTTYYAPTAVAVPLYRRGLFGGYRPVRTAYYPFY